VARALTLRPRLLLADEPTGQLDHRTGQHVIDVLLDAADETGAALVVTTHDPDIGARLTDQWEMRDGRLFVPVRGGVA
jgi:putative ABC transport system ATP-binding protein